MIVKLGWHLTNFSDQTKTGGCFLQIFKPKGKPPTALCRQIKRHSQQSFQWNCISSSRLRLLQWSYSNILWWTRKKFKSVGHLQNHFSSEDAAESADKRFLSYIFQVGWSVNAKSDVFTKIKNLLLHHLPMTHPTSSQVHPSEYWKDWHVQKIQMSNYDNWDVMKRWRSKNLSHFTWLPPRRCNQDLRHQRSKAFIYRHQRCSWGALRVPTSIWFHALWVFNHVHWWCRVILCYNT